MTRPHALVCTLVHVYYTCSYMYNVQITVHELERY